MYFPKVVEFIRNVNLLYHECTFLNDKKERAEKTYHSTAEQAASIANEANVKQLLLGHFSARYGDLEQFIAEAKPIFDNCLLATDGKRISI
ncbi:MAG: hypothetical protein WCH21_05430 [Bacteroidota bacterium]